jgi:alpha-glucoside transport system substrate-binding protein
MSTNPDDQKTQLTDMVKAVGAILGVALALFTVVNSIIAQPITSLVVALIAATLVSAWLVLSRWVSITQVITAWLALAVVVLAGFVIWPRTMTVEGVIYDTVGNPVRNEQVILFDRSGRRYETKTDAEGYYQFIDVPSGKYRVQVRTSQVEGETKGILVRVVQQNLTVSEIMPPASPTDAPVSEPPTDAPLPPTTAPKAPPVAGIDCMGAAAGDKVTLLYQWSGAEEGKFDAVVRPLVDACGIVLEPESSRDLTLMDTRIKAGRPWDVVIWPTTLALTQYPDKLVSLEEAGADPANYADYWKAMGSADGKWLAMPVKVDIKNIIWYSPAVFEANGYEVPNTWEELDALVEKMVADGNVPWSMGMESGEATGWTASDFIQDILLVQQGPQCVLDIISGNVPYNDTGVKKAYETYGKWAKDPKYTVGGAKGTVTTSFLDAIYKPFSEPPEAMMVRQAGFAITEIQNKYPDLEYGVDYDFFSVPGAKGMQGGADFLMVFNASPAAKALLAYLNSEAGALEWAWVGFDLSPNNKVTDADYSDEVLAKKAKTLGGMAGFTPDLGDTINGSFINAEWEAIIDYINGADLDKVLAKAARAHAEATQ